MNMNQKGFANIILVVVIVILVGAVGYFAFVKKQVPSESTVIKQLLASWVTTQSKFSSKAGESGTYNQPSKVQFIANNTFLVYYDDGLVDHISILQFKNGAFVELKNVGVMSTMSLSEWQALVKTYGNQNYSASNYTTSILRNGQLVNYTGLTKVSENVFVR